LLLTNDENELVKVEEGKMVLSSVDKEFAQKSHSTNNEDSESENDNSALDDDNTTLLEQHPPNVIEPKEESIPRQANKKGSAVVVCQSMSKSNAIAIVGLKFTKVPLKLVCNVHSHHKNEIVWKTIRRKEKAK